MTIRTTPVDRCAQVAGSIITRGGVTMRSAGVNPPRAGILKGRADPAYALAGAGAAGAVP